MFFEAHSYVLGGMGVSAKPEFDFSNDENRFRDLSFTERILMGPGPSNVHHRVLRAMSAPVIGHLDPDFIAAMNDTKELLQYVFQTKNDLTIPISGTGSAGMEAAFVNVVEPGDVVVVCVNGLFGERMVDVATRVGAEVVRVDAPWGRPVDPEDVRKAVGSLPAGKKLKALAFVHAETSTGVLQPPSEFRQIADERGALVIADTVTSLGGVEVKVDDWGIDVCYSGTQKCLSCPPGLAPLTLSPRAESVLTNRSTKVASWYLDLNMIRSYWGKERFYHHTAPVSMIFALREALRLIWEEGLRPRYRRHISNQRALVAGLEAMGLDLLVEPAYRLPSLTTVLVPQGIDEAEVRRELLSCYSIEIGGGLGELKGKIWRIGLMGESSTRRNVTVLLAALEQCLSRRGYKVQPGAAVAAAEASYQA